MRKGYDPAMSLDTKGNLFALATGADFTAEHEWGIKELVLELCGTDLYDSKDVEQALRAGRIKAIPEVVEARRITRDLNRIVFVEKTVNDEAQAALAYSTRFPVDPFETPYLQRELTFPHINTKQPADMVGAWDGSGFAFKVRGEKRIRQLKEFAEAMKAGNCIFAGLFLEKLDDKYAKGLAIARYDLLRPEHRTAMKDAQQRFVARVNERMQPKAAV